MYWRVSGAHNGFHLQIEICDERLNTNDSDSLLCGGSCRFRGRLDDKTKTKED